MRLKPLLIWILSCCSQHHEDSLKQYYISVKNFYGAEGYSIQYIVTPDSLKVYYNCDFEGCYEKVLYKQSNDKSNRERFERFLANYNLDTLKSRYEDKNVFDGLYRSVSFQRNSDRLKGVQLNNFDHPTIDTLLSELELLIRNGKFKRIR